MNGFLNVDKPAGLTSRDVVNRITRLKRKLKAGHAGTLDPLATGVLVVAIGPATRLIRYVQQQPKTYEAEFLLGVTSNTGDVDGDVQPLSDARPVTRSELEAILPQFTGTIQQVPPAYSAVKVQGKRAYARARAGESFELTAREVCIHKLKLTQFAVDRFSLSIDCSSGTYVRSLGRDIAQELGTAAVMSQLRRTCIGPFDVGSASDLDSLASLEDLSNRPLPCGLAVDHLPRHVMTDDERRIVRSGRPIDGRAITATEGEEVALVDDERELIAIARRTDSQLKPHLVIPEPALA